MAKLQLNLGLIPNLLSQCRHSPQDLGSPGEAEGEGRSREGVVGPAVRGKSGAEIQEESVFFKDIQQSRTSK